MKRTPRDTDHSARLITRRGLVLGGVQLGVLGVLGTRMLDLGKQCDGLLFSPSDDG